MLPTITEAQRVMVKGVRVNHLDIRGGPRERYGVLKVDDRRRVDRRRAAYSAIAGTEFEGGPGRPPRETAASRIEGVRGSSPSSCFCRAENGA